MSRKARILAFAAIGAALLFAGAALAEEKALDWKSLETVKVSLAKGLGAARQKGKPISGKFEMDEGKMQLSVYTEGKGKVLGGHRRSRDRQGLED